MSFSKKSLTNPGLLYVAVVSSVHAQTAPDAGALQQQIERDRRPSLPGRLSPEKPAEPAAMQPRAGVLITVKEFRFAGNTLLTAGRLAPVVADYLNRPLDFSQLQEATTAIANTYRDAGWVVRAYLPQQDIVDGVVTIQIVEAVFGKLQTEGEVTRLKLSTVLSKFEAQQRPGEPLNTNRLDRALLLTDDLPGVAVAGTLRPGSSSGETDLLLKLADEPLLIGDVGLDNAGGRSTGSNRLTANLTVQSPAGLGDQLTANLIHNQGSDYARLGYSIPVGADGWRIGVNASQLDYRLVASEFRSLNAKGESSSAGLDASYPIFRSRLANLFLTFAYDKKAFDNQANGGTTSRYRIDNLAVSLAGNLFDAWGGGGANSLSLAWTHGDVDLGTIDSSENRSVGGHFQKLRYSVSRQQVITADLSLLAAYAGQRGSKNLDSSEKFYLGGSSGVRAYPGSEAGGTHGQMFNLELRWKLSEGFTAVAFYDWGRITQFKEDFAGADTPNIYALSGHGLSLGWQAPFGANFKATWARRNGSNPNADTTTGKDQDGSLDKNRWWFSVNVPF